MSSKDGFLSTAVHDLQSLAWMQLRVKGHRGVSEKLKVIKIWRRLASCGAGRAPAQVPHLSRSPVHDLCPLHGDLRTQNGGQQTEEEESRHFQEGKTK